MPSSMEELADFARRLQSLREAYAGAIDLPELSASEFARMLGIPLASYEAYERGDHEPPLSVLVLFHSKTGVSLDWLIAGDGDHRRPDRRVLQRPRSAPLPAA